jgi:hypothetical protein
MTRSKKDKTTQKEFKNLTKVKESLEKATEASRYCNWKKKKNEKLGIKSRSKKNNNRPEARNFQEVADELVASEELVEEPGQELVASGRLELDQEPAQEEEPSAAADEDQNSGTD